MDMEAIRESTVNLDRIGGQLEVLAATLAVIEKALARAAAGDILVWWAYETSMRACKQLEVSQSHLKIEVENLSQQAWEGECEE